MLTSCTISDAFLHSSIRETTYFSSLFLYIHLNAREVVNFGRKISLMFFIMMTRYVIEKGNDFSMF